MNENNTLIQLIGECFGKLTVIGRANHNSSSGNARWICKCDCGSTTIVTGSNLRSGKTTSCGCNRISKRSMGHAKERIYRTWTKMHKRCYDPKSDRYKWYGEKGISICEEWHDFLTFREWALENGYTDQLTIDRIDGNKNYSPENCRWTDIKNQANNRSNNRILFYNGKPYTVSELTEKFNLKQHTIFNRLKLGWDVDRIVETPEAGES